MRVVSAGRAAVACTMAALLVLVGAAAMGCSATAELAPPPFAADSPFNTKIPDAVAVDPKSEEMIATATSEGIASNLVEFGIPIYLSSADTPRYTVPCRITTWGRCPFDGHQVPIPDGARPHTGSDGAMVVVDRQSRQSFEFWQARHDGDKWTASWAGIVDIDGSGWGGGATASGASRLGGVIRIAEIEAGKIPHALAISTQNACAKVFRAPAVATDGRSQNADCIPEGAHLRLDPALDVDALALTPAERAVATAFQVYGAYVVDRCGAPLCLSFELDTTADSGSIGSVYHKAGLRWDYDNMPGVPWNRLQVLA